MIQGKYVPLSIVIKELKSELAIGRIGWRKRSLYTTRTGDFFMKEIWCFWKRMGIEIMKIDIRLDDFCSGFFRRKLYIQRPSEQIHIIIIPVMIQINHLWFFSCIKKACVVKEFCLVSTWSENIDTMIRRCISIRSSR